MKLINKETAMDLVKKMPDIDGYREGDCVSRRAVIALLDQMQEKDLSMYEDDLK